MNRTDDSEAERLSNLNRKLKMYIYIYRQGHDTGIKKENKT